MIDTSRHTVSPSYLHQRVVPTHARGFREGRIRRGKKGSTEDLEIFRPTRRFLTRAGQAASLSDTVLSVPTPKCARIRVLRRNNALLALQRRVDDFFPHGLVNARRPSEVPLKRLDLPLEVVGPFPLLVERGGAGSSSRPSCSSSSSSERAVACRRKLRQQ